MKKTTLIILLALFSFSTFYFAQGRRFRGEGMKRIEQLEKIKLLEALNLDEETSIKFFSRLKSYREKIRDSRDLIDSLYLELEYKIKNQKLDANDVVFKKLYDELLKTEQNIIKIRMDFVASLSNILTNEQIAKILLFEKKFKEEIQEILMRQREKFKNE